MQNYYNNRFIGTQIEELIKLFLDTSGYHVYSFGYEHTFPSICEKYREVGIRSTDTALRIRYSPDLLVYDGEHNELRLVEVKMRKANPDMEVYISRFEIKNYQKYWSDALLVVVTNDGNIFYAQEIAKLDPSGGFYKLPLEFQKFEEMFTQIKEDLSEYKNKAIQILNTNSEKNIEKSKTKHISILEKRKVEANSKESTTQHNSRYYCNECMKPITNIVFKYSIRNFNNPLCWGCQPVKEKTSSVPPSKPELNKSVGIEIGGKVPQKKPIHDGY